MRKSRQKTANYVVEIRDFRYQIDNLLEENQAKNSKERGNRPKPYDVDKESRESTFPAAGRKLVYDRFNTKAKKKQMATVTIRSVSCSATYHAAIDKVTAKIAYQIAFTYQRGKWLLLLPSSMELTLWASQGHLSDYPLTGNRCGTGCCLTVNIDHNFQRGKSLNSDRLRHRG